MRAEAEKMAEERTKALEAKTNSDNPEISDSPDKP
jgi:hypothetical protein